MAELSTTLADTTKGLAVEYIKNVTEAIRTPEVTAAVAQATLCILSSEASRIALSRLPARSATSSTSTKPASRAVKRP